MLSEDELLIAINDLLTTMRYLHRRGLPHLGLTDESITLDREEGTTRLRPFARDQGEREGKSKTYNHRET